MVRAGAKEAVVVPSRVVADAVEYAAVAARAVAVRVRPAEDESAEVQRPAEEVEKPGEPA